MEKMDIKIKDHDYKNQRDALVETIRTDPRYIHWCAQHDLDQDSADRILNANAFKFETWLNQCTPCASCSGLNHCIQAIRGFMPSLSYNGAFLENGFIACTYKTQDDQTYAFLKNYRLNDYANLRHLVGEDWAYLLKHGERGRRVVSILIDWTRSSREKGFYIYGPTGTGKTYAAMVVANLYAKKGKSVCAINFPTWVSASKFNLDVNDAKTADDIRLMCQCDFLLLDDVGATTNSAWIRDELLFPILNHRMENHKLTFITSNMDMEGLETFFANTSSGKASETLKSQRLIERIKVLCEPLVIDGIDFRLHPSTPQ